MKFITLHKRKFRQGEEERIYLNPIHVIAIEGQGRALIIMVGGRHYEVEESAQEVLDQIETAWGFITTEP